MIFHEIDMTGKIWIERLATPPSWTSDDVGRIFYCTGNGYIYFGQSSGWQTINVGTLDTFIRADTSDSHAGTITPTVDNTYDLGGSSYRYANIYGVTFQGTTTTATYADLAEKYTMDKEYPVGTLLRIAEEGEYEMTMCDRVWCLCAGVISDKPGFLLNADSIGQPVALVGKTPIRVTGPIEKGDYLGINGDGTAVRTSGSMIAQALETNLDEDEKLVMCLLKL